MRGLALGLALLAAPAWAAPARVLSGEHDGFTRLVVELPAPSAWTLGRSADGYALRLDGSDGEYDLSQAFKLIGRSRIAALAADAQTGDLYLALACNCHVEPFEFRPGIIVLDLKDGPPAKDSLYEQELPGVAMTEIAIAEPQSLPKANPEQVDAFAQAWVDTALGIKPPADNPIEAAPSELPRSALLDPGLTPLRDDLVREISRGAATGVVMMDLPEGAPMPTESQPDETDDQSRVGLENLGALPQVRIEGTAAETADLAQDGENCPRDAQLDLESWGDDRPVWDQISQVRSDLVGEFDRPNPEAVVKAVKLHLFIGFGQEANGLLKSFGSDDPDARLWSSLAHIIDDSPDPDPAFAGLEACESAASLWAILTRPQAPTLRPNLPAIQRSFSALPMRLRHEVGPRLIETLISLGEAEAVDVVANAIRRAGDPKDRDIALMEAEVAASDGAFAEADGLLKPLLDDPGPNTPEALVAFIEGQAARGLPVPPETLAEIDAYAMERTSGPEGAKFQRALVLALALTGQFKQAFETGASMPEIQADLWRLLAALGTDDAILEQASVMPGSAAPESARPIASDLAERFLRLGLPGQAQIWLAGAQSVDRMLAAQIAVANSDGLSALTYLEGLDTDAARALRTEAKVLIGDDISVAADLAVAGDGAGETAALARARDWPALEQKGQTEWQTAAKSLTAQPEAGLAGPLAEGAAIADQAQATREAVKALLATVPAPENPTP